MLAALSAYYLFPLIAFGLSPLLPPLEVVLELMFFYPQFAFPSEFIVGLSEVARKKTIPTVSLAYWGFFGFAFAALFSRLRFWKILLIAYLLLVPAAVLFSYILRGFGFQIQLDGP